MDWVELAARFSYITNSLRFCGPEEASKQFVDYINEKSSAESVRESIRKFEGLYPYLSSIAEKTKKDFLDYDVVEAYWIGNELLEEFNDGDIKGIIRKLINGGLPKSIGEKLMKNMPNGFVPHHNFNVFYVGVGRTTGSVPTTLNNMDNCRVSYGKVVEILKDKLIVSASSLKKEKNKLIIKEHEPKTAVYIPEILKGVKKDDIVALHWGFACAVLNQRQLENLKKYSQRILDVLNG